jgi:hypothetical protein
MEQHAKVAMLPFASAWSDVGSWNAVADLTPADAQGNRLHGQGFALQSSNTFVHAPHRPGVVLGTQNLLVIDTSRGRILVELDPLVAPNHVVRVRTLADQGFYDSLTFHRVLTGFMAQTGDPLGTGAGGSELPDIAGEFSFRRGRDAGFQSRQKRKPQVKNKERCSKGYRKREISSITAWRSGLQASCSFSAASAF